MIPTSVRFAIVLVAAFLCANWIKDGKPIPAALSGAAALVLAYNHFRSGRLVDGIRRMDEGLYEDARRSFEGALRWVSWRGRGTAVAAHTRLAMLDLRQGDADAAADHLDAAESYSPSAEQQHRIAAQRAALLIRQEEYEEANRHLVTLAARMPGERTMTWVQALLALTLMKQGKVHEAGDIIALALGPVRNDKDRQTRLLVYSVAAKVNDAADEPDRTEKMLRLAIEHGMLRNGDAEGEELARKYGFAKSETDA